MENPVKRIAAKFQYKIPSLWTLAVADTISWSRGRPHRESCTFLQRSWSRKDAVDVNTFFRPHLRNWCWKPFSVLLLLLLLLLLSMIILNIVLIVLGPSISSLLQSGTEQHNVFVNRNALFETRWNRFQARLSKLRFSTFSKFELSKCSIGKSFGCIQLWSFAEPNRGNSNAYSSIESDYRTFDCLRRGISSLRSRRLEVVGERENGHARGRHARGEGAPARKAPENRFNSHSVSADISNWLRGSRGKI